MKQKILLFTLLIISILIVGLNDFILKDVPEISKLGDELGAILSNLSLAYISSYIFYIVVVEIKEARDKKNILRAVYHLTDDLVDNGYAIVSEIMGACKVGIADYDKRTMTKEEYFRWCEKVDLKFIPKNQFFGSIANPQYAYLTKFIYNSTVYHVDKKITKLHEYMTFLDSDFLALLNKLQRSTFYQRDAFQLSQSSEIANIPGLTIGKNKAMYDYLEIVREIEQYNNKHHLKYK
jgi:hypothetical protein